MPRPARPPEYHVLPARHGGYVALRRRGRRREYLGRDGYWARRRDHALPFASLDDAVREAEGHSDDELVRPLCAPEVHE
jgi:hypothetical protein